MNTKLMKVKKNSITKIEKDLFGNRMKQYEQVFTADRIRNDQWMAVRIDGRSFSKYTAGFSKPFDPIITDLMIETTKILVKETGASIGYTQSDEISLLYPPPERPFSQRIFNGKVSKINSVFASIATAHFNSMCMNQYNPKQLAYFDCRVWEVPFDHEASNVLLWRAQDARKNSISSLFRWTAGAKPMHGLNGNQMIDYLRVNFNTDWHDLPNKYKYGTFVKPMSKQSELSKPEMQKIPESKRHNMGIIQRTCYEVLDIGYFGDLPMEDRIKLIR